MRIALTPNYMDYYQNEENYIFAPCMWVLASDNFNVASSYKLTEAGLKFASQYKDDASYGYGLCDGKAKGLASEYSDYTAWMEIVTNPEYCENPADADYDISIDIL